ncbi:unnamed protein product [Polarella glacialis]|uniref:Uncharacterized protein n=1 Tax=Polarella glacialis TaxID=89957 RepID=A0A813LED9_POLGL|nr:unnamed protein product [Polarella glacialis]
MLAGIKAMERMLHGELLLDVRGVEALNNLDLYYLTDWTLAVSRTRVVVSTRKSPEEWTNAMHNHNVQASASGLPRVYRLVRADGSEWASAAKHQRRDDTRNQEPALAAGWPRERLLATPSMRLPMFEDQALSEWLCPGFLSVFNPLMPGDVVLTVEQISITKRVNKSGRWGRKDINIDMPSANAASLVASSLTTFYQHDLSLGAIQWQIHSPHFAADPLEVARNGIANLALADGTAATKAAEDHEQATLKDFFLQAAAALDSFETASEAGKETSPSNINEKITTASTPVSTSSKNMIRSPPQARMETASPSVLRPSQARRTENISLAEELAAAGPGGGTS